MLNLPNWNILLCVEPTGMRKSFDSLAILVRSHLNTSPRLALRQSKAAPCLQELKSWLEKQRVEALPKSPIAEAVNYSLDQWEALKIYTCDGNIAIDNNIAERAIKPFAIGRKNWLYFGSDRGGKSLGILSSFTATCQQFGINPGTYLRDTLTKLLTTPADQLHTLLTTKYFKITD